MQEKIFHPNSNHTATSMGSGGLDILATPALVAFMENLAYEVLQERLEPGQSSVGSRMDIQHLAPSFIHQAVTVRLMDWKNEGRKQVFQLQALVAGKEIARAEHTRFLVDIEKFLGKLE